MENEDEKLYEVFGRMIAEKMWEQEGRPLVTNLWEVARLKKDVKVLRRRMLDLTHRFDVNDEEFYKEVEFTMCADEFDLEGETLKAYADIVNSAEIVSVTLTEDLQKVRVRVTLADGFLIGEEE